MTLSVVVTLYAIVAQHVPTASPNPRRIQNRGARRDSRPDEASGAASLFSHLLGIVLTVFDLLTLTLEFFNNQHSFSQSGLFQINSKIF